MLATGVREHGGTSLGVSRKDGINDGVGRVSGGNEWGREHKIVSVSNMKLWFCNGRTLDGSSGGFCDCF